MVDTDDTRRTTNDGQRHGYGISSPQVKLVPLAHLKISAGPGQPIPKVYFSLLPVLKYNNMCTRTVDCNP